jgi:hypothetical protein
MAPEKSLDRRAMEGRTKPQPVSIQSLFEREIVKGEIRQRRARSLSSEIENQGSARLSMLNRSYPVPGVEIGVRASGTPGDGDCQGHRGTGQRWSPAGRSGHGIGV